ncbi:MAG: hypothetical protein ACI4J7_06070 [Ruminiclostridium sp.]
MEINDIIAIVIGIIIAAVIAVYLILNQKKKIIEWLKGAVAKAEKLLGSGTGQLKLRQVYDWYIDKFPILAAILPFKVFSAWVDVALKAFNEWLDKNDKIAGYVNNADKGD